MTNRLVMGTQMNTNWELMFENKTHFQLFNILQEMGEKLKCIDNHKTQPNHF